MYTLGSEVSFTVVLVKVKVNYVANPVEFKTNILLAGIADNGTVNS